MASKKRDRAAPKKPRPARAARKLKSAPAATVVAQDEPTTRERPFSVLAQNLKRPSVQRAIGLVVIDVVVPFFAGLALFLTKQEDKPETPPAPKDDPDSLGISGYTTAGPRVAPAARYQGLRYSIPDTHTLIVDGGPICPCPRCTARRAKEAN